MTRTSIFSRVHSNTVNHIAECLLKSFLSSLNDTNNNAMLTPFIIYKVCVGYPIDNVISLENTLVMDIPIPLEFPDDDSGVSNATVALFECSLENLAIHGDENIRMESDNNNESLMSVEFNVLEKWANVIDDSKINIIMCQRRIHPYLQRLLRDRGIISLPRLSIHFISSMQKLTGAKIMGSLPSNLMETIPCNCLGYIGNLRKKIMLGRTFILASSIPLDFETFEIDNSKADSRMVSLALNEQAFINGVLQRRQKISSLIITGPTKYICDEIQDSFEIVISNLSSLFENSYVLPGGGCWQMYLAQRLKRSFLEKSEYTNKRIVSKAMKVYIDTFTSCAYLISKCPVNIDKNNIQNTFILPSISTNDRNLYFGNPSGAYTKAVKVNNEYKISSSNMIDCFQSSQKSIELAVEIAITLLQIESVIVAKPIEINKSI